MILHLIDDEKIAPRTIEIFNKALPGQNCFICFRMPQKRVKSSNDVFYDDEVGAVDFLKYTKVFIHYLSKRKIEFYNRYIKHDVETYWFIWGGDIYNDLMASRGFDVYYEPLYGGGRMFLKNKLSKLGIKPFHKAELQFIKGNIDYVLTSEEEYILQKKYLGKYLPKRFVCDFFYYPIDTIVGESLAEKWCNLESKQIVVGNCATVSNNHCYVFAYLNKCRTEGWKVVPVLSYGGTPKYIEHVKVRGRKLFGNEFAPQLRFLPLDEYNAFMLNSGYFVYGNWRQEAVGNIVIALYLGAKVFISKRSPLLLYFRKLGLTVFELESINSNSMVPLSEENRINNRAIMKDFYNEERLINIVKSAWG